MKKTAQGNTLLIVIILVLLLGGGLIYLKMTQDSKQTQEALPPVEQRTNPEPQSKNTISVATVNPGKTVSVESVSLEDGGYVYVYKDTSGKRTLIGKSKLLNTGSTSNLQITLTSIKDGDVIYLTLMAKDGAAIKDENKNAIEVQKNVGMLMNHYQNEY